MNFIRSAISALSVSKPSNGRAGATTDADAASSTTTTTVRVIPDDIAKKLKHVEDLRETMKPYNRHVVVCMGGDASLWKSDLCKPDTPYIYALSSYVESIEPVVGYSVRVTASDEPIENASDYTEEELAEGDIADLILFPDRIVFPSVKLDRLEEWVRAIFIDDKGEVHYRTESKKAEARQSLTAHLSAASDLIKSNLNLLEENKSTEVEAPPSLRENWLELDFEHHEFAYRSCVMVCTHRLRDKRCGVAGNLLVDQLREDVVELKLTQYVKILRVSHVGGHKFAAVAIVHPEAVWYGLLTPAHAKLLLKANVLQDSEAISKLDKNVRGYMTW